MKCETSIYCFQFVLFPCDVLSEDSVNLYTACMIVSTKTDDQTPGQKYDEHLGKTWPKNLRAIDSR